MPIPEFLRDMLTAQYGAEVTAQIYEGFAAKRKTTLRVNTIKTDADAVKSALQAAGIACEAVASIYR